jgi:hypothetical protein
MARSPIDKPLEYFSLICKIIVTHEKSIMFLRRKAKMKRGPASLCLKFQLRRDLVQIGHGQRSDVTYDVIVRVKRLEDFGCAMATRDVDDLVCSEFASRSQFLAIRFQPDLRLAMINWLCLQRRAFFHGAILLLRTRVLTRIPSPTSFPKPDEAQWGESFMRFHAGKAHN